MRTVTLIQFTERTEHEYGYEPDIGRYYYLSDLDSSLEIEDELDEDAGVLDAIKIRMQVRNSVRDRYYPARMIVKNEDDKYNLLTIELDETSQLFKF